MQHLKNRVGGAVLLLGVMVVAGLGCVLESIDVRGDISEGKVEAGGTVCGAAASDRCLDHVTLRVERAVQFGRRSLLRRYQLCDVSDRCGGVMSFGPSDSHELNELIAQRRDNGPFVTAVYLDQQVLGIDAGTLELRSATEGYNGAARSGLYAAAMLAVCVTCGVMAMARLRKGSDQQSGDSRASPDTILRAAFGTGVVAWIGVGLTTLALPAVAVAAGAVVTLVGVAVWALSLRIFGHRTMPTRGQHSM